MKPILFTVGSFLLLAIAGGCNNFQEGDRKQVSQQQEPQIITLTQTGCQFLETESKDYKFTTNSAEDCNQINDDTLAERKKGFVPINLTPGDYIFRVTNQNVPYELGFYLRGDGIKGVALPKVSGGGLTKGTTQDYSITLRPGKYVFSCPLNPTPDYPLVVQ